MRLFFALELPGQLAMAIADWRERQLSNAGRPVPAANFHLTLAFLGELAQQQLDALCRDVDSAMEKQCYTADKLVLNQVGYWPRPGIYWLGPKDWPETLDNLALKLGTLGAVVGDQKRRDRFQPHITLFRSCDAAPPAPASPPHFELPYRELLLMESRQGKRGVSYHPVAGWELAGKLRKAT